MESGSRWRTELSSSGFPLSFFPLGFTHFISMEAKPDKKSVWTDSNLDVWSGVKKKSALLYGTRQESEEWIEDSYWRYATGNSNNPATFL